MSTSASSNILLQVLLVGLLLPYLVIITTSNCDVIDHLINLICLDTVLSDSTYCGQITTPAVLLVSGLYLQIPQTDSATSLTESSWRLFKLLPFDYLPESRLDQLFTVMHQYPQNSSSWYLFGDGLNNIIFSVPTSKAAVISFGLKFITLILLLIFVRGGIPRYRYDFLTKMGWFKYFSWVLLFFILSFFLYILFS